jgi:hypothetical protein
MGITAKILQGVRAAGLKLKTMKDSAARTEYRLIATSAGSGADRSNLE